MNKPDGCGIQPVLDVSKLDGDELMTYFLAAGEDEKRQIKEVQERYGKDAVLAPAVELKTDGNGKPLIDFEQFTLKEFSETMEARMLDDVRIFGQMAIMGQFTAFYGGPNSGKTLIGLKLLTEAIRAALFNASQLYYINADDTYRGIVTKKKIAEEYGFNIIVPSMEGFKADYLLEILPNKAVNNTASGCIVILDTLKKFTDLMSKNASSAFGDVARSFVSAGGTIIGYAHVNKAKDDEGLSVHAGTADIIDDADCAYILDLVEDDGKTRTVTFRNIKDRGDVAQMANYQYKSKGNDPSVPYLETLHSVREVKSTEAIEAQKRAAIAARLAVNHEAIMAVIECINNGITKKTSLVAKVIARTGISKPKALEILREHEGTNKLDGHRWNHRIGDKNAHVYFTI